MGCIKCLYQGASHIRGPLLAPSRLGVNVAALSCSKDLALLYYQASGFYYSAQYFPFLFTFYTGDRLSFSSLSIDFTVIAVKNFPMMSAPRVLILGHSFVRRLSSFLSNSASYSSDLALADLANVSLFGVGGRTVAKVEKFDLDHVRISKPDIVILELGTNDLTCLPPESVGSALKELVHTLKHNCGVRVVGVCQVIKRSSSPPKMRDFNSRVLKLHKYLKVVLEPVPFCFYWRHIGFWNPSSDIYLKDGVHLNTLGLMKLYRSYRGAVLKSLSLLNGA